MSRIDQLIQEHCPNGVQHVSLGELIQIRFGERITKTKDSGTIYPVYGGGGESFRTDSYNREDEWVLSRFAMSEKCVRRVNGKFWMLDSGFTFEVAVQEVEKDFIAQILLQLQPLIFSTSTQSAQKNIDIEGFKRILIPIPPLEVQQEIVRVLNLFQKLEAELEAELEARRKQHEVFREIRFDFAKETEMEWGTIGEFCSTFSGSFVKKTEQDDSYAYPVFNGGSSATGFFNDYNSPENSIAISARGSIGSVNWVKSRFWAGNSCHVVLATDPKLNNRFLYHYLKFHEPSLYALRAVGTIPALNLKPLLTFKIPIPSLSIQVQISAELDTYESIMYGADGSISAELNARRKQYEYYRDKLLTFEEAA